MGNTVKKMKKKKSEALAVHVGATTRNLTGSGAGGFAPGAPRGAYR